MEELLKKKPVFIIFRDLKTKVKMELGQNTAPESRIRQWKKIL